jgi:Zn-dependent peptidase ImmA (M78 family)
VPTNLGKIFQSLGLKYIELDDPKDIDGAILEIDNKPSIAVLNKAKPLQRQRFTLAHELAHIFLKHKQRDTYDPEAERDLPEDVEHGKPSSEIEADIFAAELLIPFDQIKKFEKEISNVEKIAGIFQVSKQAMTLAIMNYWKHSRTKRKKY